MRPALTTALSIIGVAAAVFFVVGGGAHQVMESTRRAASASYTGATWFVASITKRDLAKTYESATRVFERVSDTDTEPFAKKKKNVRILIVPGHEPAAGGALFNNVYERDLVYLIAESLREILSMNPRYEVMLARTDAAWHPALETYFAEQADAILTFRDEHQQQMDELIAEGVLSSDLQEAHHAGASSEAVLHLYGINKWASEGGIDIVLHLHLNDYPGRRASREGEHAGFAVYVPLEIYSNGKTSKEIADAIASRLSAYHAVSTLPQEAAGVIESRSLIATGAHNTAEHASLLIEYGYIYEPQFHDEALRSLVVADYAYQTYLGLQDFFEDPVLGYGSVAFPYDWKSVIGVQRGAPIYALQAALRHLGFYPAEGASFTECPLTGILGSCTKKALSAYQTARGLSAHGELDVQTAEALAGEFAVRL